MVDLVKRYIKGTPLTHEEMDGNFAALSDATDSKAPLTGEGATGNWGISVTGTASNVTEVINVSKGGTGATTTSAALTALGAYPASNPNSYIRANQAPVQSVGGFGGSVTKTQLGIDKVTNTADVDKIVSIPQQAALDLKISIDQKNISDGVVGLTGFGIDIHNNAGSVKNQIVSIATLPRTYTLQNVSGTIAMLTDITGANSGINTGDETEETIKVKLGIQTLSGVNTGDETKTTILTKLEIPSISGTNTGDQSLTSLGIPNVENKSSAQIRSEITYSNITTSLNYVPADNAKLAVANGIATLGSDGKLSTAQIPASLVGALVYQSVWNPVTNVPTLTSGVGTKGHYYKVSASGTFAIDGNSTWNIGDHIIFNGTTWDRLEGDSTEVNTVAGRTGTVVLTATDIGGLAASATINTTNANNITSGTLASVRLPAFTGGDVTAPVGSTVLVLPPTGVSAGTYGSATHTPTFTVDTKGRLTIASQVLLTPTWDSVTNKPTTVAGYDITDALSTTNTVTVAQGGTGSVSLTGYVKGNGTASMSASPTIPGADIVGNITGSASSLTTSRNIVLSGDATGSAAFNGTTNATIAVTLANSGVVPATVGSGSVIPILNVNAKGLIIGTSTAVNTPNWSNVTNKPTTILGYGITDAVNVNTVGAANGIATLGNDGKLTSAQIPSSLVGALVYQGTWNAATNTPTLITGTGTKGHYYKVSIAGVRTIDDNSNWNVGDHIIFNGVEWDRVEGDSTEVLSVAGRVGAVVLAASDISGLAASATINTTIASNISSGTLAVARLPAMTGDVSAPVGTHTTTLSTTGVTAGAYGSSTQASTFTVDAKGRLTVAGQTTITPAFASITAKPTTLAGYGITDAVSSSGGSTTQSITIASSASILYFQETDQTLPAGKWRLVADGNLWRLDKNTAVAGDFSTYTTGFTVDASGKLTFETQVIGDNSTRGATTAFTVAQIANSAPTKTGGGASGNWNINAVNVTGIVAVANGGTGATSVSGAVSNLGLGNVENKSSSTIRSEITSVNITTALSYTPVNPNTLGTNNGVATLDSSGKLTPAQIPASLVGGLNYQGTWNASTNSPTLASGVGTKGHYYKVSIAGSASVDGNSDWALGDIIAYNGTTWDQIDGGQVEVLSVAGRIGAVVLSSADISGLAPSATTDTTNAANISSGTLLAARMPAHTGDVTSPVGSTVLTLANTAVTSGSYGNGSSVTTFTVDSKGRLTTAGSVAVTPAWNNVTGKPTTLTGYGITDAIQLGTTPGANLSSALVGSSTTAARSDHSHKVPTVEELNNVSIFVSTETDILYHDGSNWTNRSKKDLLDNVLLYGERKKAVSHGLVTTGTKTFNYSLGTYQHIQAQSGQPLTFAFSNFPVAGELGVIVLEGQNLGSTTITWPTINWLKSDNSGTFTTTFSEAGVTLQAVGTDFIVIWSRTGGFPYYGRVIR